MKAIRFLMSLVLICSLACIAEAAKVELLIIPPDNDGGATLVGYHIDYKRVKEERWTRANSDPIPAIKVEVNGKFEYAAVPYIVNIINFKDGTEYEIRVCAQNIYFMGEWSRSEKLQLDENTEESIRLKCGEMPSIPSHRMFEDGNICVIPEKGMIFRKEEDMV